MRRCFSRSSRSSWNSIRTVAYHASIEDDYEDKVNVYKVNVNFDAELAEKYAVMASPTILFFKGGEEVSRIRGLVKRNALEEEVGKLL